MGAVLKCRDVCRKFRDFSLKSNSFELESGYLTGMIGLNGAGKSTLINILAGIDENYEGQIIVDGLDLREHYVEAKQKIAIVSERISHFMDKKPLENGELLGKYFENWSTESFYLWLDKMDVPKGQTLHQLSKGQYMKYQMAFAMAYSPKFLLLDEPTAGFDPVFRKDFMKILQDVRDKDIGILMSTHILSDIEYIADYILVMNSGSLVLNDTREALENNTIQDMIRGSLNGKSHIGTLLRRNGVRKDDVL